MRMLEGYRWPWLKSIIKSVVLSPVHALTPPYPPSVPPFILMAAVSSLPVPRWLELGLYDDLALIITHLRNGSHPLCDPAWEIGGAPQVGAAAAAAVGGGGEEVAGGSDSVVAAVGLPAGVADMQLQLDMQLLQLQRQVVVAQRWRRREIVACTRQ